MKAAAQLIVALDLETLDQAGQLLDRAGAEVVWYKVGKQLFTRRGPEAVALLKAQRKRVFLDLKYHDIPNTVAEAVRAAADIGVDLVNVHASGGPAMLEAAAQAASRAGIALVAVTVLTSLSADDLAAVGCPATPEAQVLRLAALAQRSGIHGVVCSALEIPALRRSCGPDFLLVVPGIRPGGSGHDDQKRVLTPAEAVRAGADYLVVGRPITQARDPAAVARAVLAEMASAQASA